MTDEAGILLRVSIFGFVAGVVYWFLSYEWLGTVALLLLGGMELNGIDDAWIHGFGATLLASRVLHAWGLSRHAGTSPGRLAGTALTLVLMVAMSVVAIAAYLEPRVGF